MPRLATGKHPEFSRRNAMVVSSFHNYGLIKAMEDFDLSRRRIFQIIREYEGPKTKSYSHIRGYEAKRILQLYEKLSMSAVARLVGRSKKTIKRFLKRMGIQPRTRGWKVVRRKKDVPQATI